MPTYDYICAACDHEWEEFQAMSAKPSRKCPECGKLKAKRQIGAGAGLIFKGSCFYVTDYKKTAPIEKPAGGSKSTGKSSSSSEGKSSSDTKSSSSDSSSSKKKTSKKKSPGSD